MAIHLRGPVIAMFSILLILGVTVCESFHLGYQERRSSAAHVGTGMALNDVQEQETNRRSAVSKMLGLSLFTIGSSALPKDSNAYSPADPVGAVQSDTSDTSTMIDETFVPLAKITHKVTFNVRISRADGTFYVRDDPPDTVPSADNQVFYGQIVLGLFGEAAPTIVDRFLQYADVQYTPADDDPLPSFARSSFQSLDQTNGLLQGGYIPGLHLTSFAGSSTLEYGGKILGAPLWIEKGDKSKKVSHSAGRGLLTHRNLEVLPVFGITTRPLSDLGSGVVSNMIQVGSFLQRMVNFWDMLGRRFPLSWRGRPNYIQLWG